MRSAAMGNPTLVFTDRNDLDDQLFGEVFAASRVLSEAPKSAYVFLLSPARSSRATAEQACLDIQQFGRSDQLVDEVTLHAYAAPCTEAEFDGCARVEYEGHEPASRTASRVPVTSKVCPAPVQHGGPRVTAPSKAAPTRASYLSRRRYSGDAICGAPASID